MLKLNLIAPEYSQVGFKINHFPDGQQSISDVVFKDYKEVKRDGVMISSRLNSFRDLELILCATKALKNKGINKVALDIPYVLGSRSDRSFESQGLHYLRDVLAPIINLQRYEFVSCLDPHSYVTEGVLNKCVIDNTTLIKFYDWSLAAIKPKNATIISPDMGAIKRADLISKILNTSNIAVCSKNRDLSTGKIISTLVPEIDLTRDLILIDDICDGGITFIEIGSIIDERKTAIIDVDPNFQCGQVYLIVTHGIFSKGCYELGKHFDGVYCTNSIKDIDSNDLIKQFNIF